LIGFSCFYHTVHDCTGSCTCYRGVEQESFSTQSITFYTTFSGIVGYLTSAIEQIVTQSLFMIQGIVQCFFKLTSSKWIDCFYPFKEAAPNRYLFFLTFHHSLIRGEILKLSFNKEKLVAISKPYFCRYLFLIILQFGYLRFLDRLFGIDIQQLQIFASVCRYRFKELSAAVCQTADKDMAPKKCSKRIQYVQSRTD